MLSFGSSVRLAAAVAACAFVAPVYADAPPISLTVSATGAAGSFGKNVQVNATSTSASGVGTYIGSAAGTNGTSSNKFYRRFQEMANHLDRLKAVKRNNLKRK